MIVAVFAIVALTGCTFEDDAVYKEAYNEGHQAAMDEVKSAVEWELGSSVYSIYESAFLQGYDAGYYDAENGDEDSPFSSISIDDKVDDSCGEILYWLNKVIE